MFSEAIKKYIKEVDKIIENILLHRKPTSLYVPMYYLLEAGGKRIRPVLLMLSCSVVGGRIKDSLKAAAAIELLHTFTLVHDDIMDKDDLRRGMKTVHRKWDDSTAILAGDGLVTVAYQTLLKTKSDRIKDIMECFTDGLLVLCEGQALDKEFEKSDNVSLEQYEDMIGRKTAKLMEVSCLIGGMIGKARAGELDKLKQFSFSLGKAFQIQDDLLDVMSRQDIAGKPVGSDIIAKKKTYLTIHFQKNSNPQNRGKFNALWKKKKVVKSDIQEIRELFVSAGTISAAKTAIDALIRNALDNLAYFRSSDTRDQLENVVLKIKERNS